MDEEYMSIAIELAKKGKGLVNPNPLVGAIIVKQGQIIGEGFHEYYGGPHAEVNAFKSVPKEAFKEVEGSTIYVTLEPCCHYGKTPPCVNAIIGNKIKRVVIGCLDPNPLVSGKSIEILKNNGIEVTIGILEEECKKINEVFIKYVYTKIPYVIMKSAMTLDGKIATYSGESKWITGEEARAEVHKLRNEFSSIMVGIGTILGDNPELTCRIGHGRNPIRIVVDSCLRIPLDSKVINIKDNSFTIVATTDKADKDKIKLLKDKGVKVMIIPMLNEKVDLRSLMIKLGELNIDGVLLEGGSTLNYSALEQGIVDKVQFYIAPKIIGGSMAKTPVGGNGISSIMNAIMLKNLSVSNFGNDILVQGYIQRGEN